MDPLLALLVLAAAGSVLAALVAPGERGEPVDERTRQTLQDQLAAWQ